MRFLAILTCAALMACDGESDKPKADYSKCGVPAKIVMDDRDLLTHCLMDGGDAGPVPCDPPVLPELALAKGVETTIPLRVEDEEGDLCDPSALQIEIGDESLVTAVSLGEVTVLQVLRDFLDDGEVEPATLVRLSIASLTAEWKAVGVISLEGTWEVTVYHPEMYPDGLLIGEFVFTQRGRHLKWYDCTIDEACDEAGTVQDDRLTLMTMDANFRLDGWLLPGRDAMEGSWSTTHYEGTWSAKRVPE